jgi:DNA-binding transcriptional LysR family regulator
MYVAHNTLADGLGTVDLNLLLPLSTLLEEQHISRAAKRVGLSQSAMSRLLQRVRKTFGDDLLTQAGRGYALTPRGTALRGELQRLLPRLENLIRGETFDPATATNRFRLACSEEITQTIGASLIRLISAAAPHAVLDIVPRRPRAFEEMEAGQLDIAVCAARFPDSLHHEALLREWFGCLMSRDHPMSSGHIDLQRYVEYAHIAIVPDGDRQAPIDDHLDALGLARRVAARVNSMQVAAQALVETGLLATMPLSAAMALSGDKLTFKRAPIELPWSTHEMAWAGSREGDAAHAWLRQMIRAAIMSLPKPSPRHQIKLNE